MATSSVYVDLEDDAVTVASPEEEVTEAATQTAPAKADPTAEIGGGPELTVD